MVNKVEAMATFLIVFGAHMTILYSIKVEIFMLIKQSFEPPPPSLQKEIKNQNYVDY